MSSRISHQQIVITFWTRVWKDFSKIYVEIQVWSAVEIQFKTVNLQLRSNLPKLISLYEKSKQFQMCCLTLYFSTFHSLLLIEQTDIQVQAIGEVKKIVDLPEKQSLLFLLCRLSKTTTYDYGVWFLLTWQNGDPILVGCQKRNEDSEWEVA